MVAALALAPATASAWGALGHRVAAEFAAAQLTPAARAEADRLLAAEPGATLVSIANWADEIRSPATSPWHYLNFPAAADCFYDAERLCPQGQCVVEAVERQRAVLASNAPDAERLQALKFLVHLVPDAHQPMHGGMDQDRGGNKTQLQAFDEGTNLHALWDSGLIRHWDGGLRALRAAVAAVPPATGATPAPSVWSEESCRIVKAVDFYPPAHKLDAEYPQRWGPVLVQRLARAGQRLAAVLNAALGER